MIATLDADLFALNGKIRSGRFDRTDLLVLADWHEEHGDDFLADLIRKRCREKRDAIASTFRPYGLAGRSSSDWAVDNFSFKGLTGWVRKNIPRPLTAHVMARAGSRLYFKNGLLWHVDAILDWWHRHGPALAGRHPIASVEITGDRPVHAGPSNECVWTHVPLEAPNGYNVIPKPIWDHIEDLGAPWQSPRTFKTFSCPGNARHALDGAAPRWALAEANRLGVYS